MTDREVVLASGGLDSATFLAIALDKGYDCFALSFEYGQRSISELAAAKRVVVSQEVIEHRIVSVGLDALGGSTLTDKNLAVPEGWTEGASVTDVPARNTVFLAYALAWAEVIDASAIYIGVNLLDYSGYTDCRPARINAVQNMMDLSTKEAVEGSAMFIIAPPIEKSKADIVKTGMELGVETTGSLSRAIRQVKKETPVAYAIVVAFGSKGSPMLNCVIRLATSETCRY